MNTRKISCINLLILVLTLSLILGSFGCAASPVPSSTRLVIVIVVDQFRYDFLERFKASFGAGGFRRLMDQGALFTNANYNYMPTYTAPGHAAVFTGAGPAQNGIVGNNWYDRATDSERVMVSDPDAKVVTSYGTQSYTKATKPASPRVLNSTTFGDQMRLATNFHSKVVSMSYKDRSAVLPGGRNANGAYWFDASSGTFVSSDYYFREMPAWVNRFNSQHKPDVYFGKVWDRMLDAKAYETTQGVTTDVKGSPLGRHFPYRVTGGEEKPGEEYYKAFQYTPFASETLADFAKAAIEGEELGADAYPDLLAISFSTPDLVGHAYGPDSEEVEDTYIRLDRVIADLLDYIDSKVGLSTTLIAVTGDHGVSPVPRLLNLNRQDAEVIEPARCRAAVNDALKARFGGDNWVLALVNDQVYLDRKVTAAQKADPAEAERVVADTLMGVPGVAAAYTRTQILSGQLPSSPLGQRMANGFNPARSGDVWLITKPFHFIAEGEISTTHGSGYDYDTHVPIILRGPAIQAGRYYQECSPVDIAPTFCALLGVEPPASRTGRVLAEALKQP
jgi:predicted AlkP superfamily pyrophosphatase or phosphodiesterase